MSSSIIVYYIVSSAGNVSFRTNASPPATSASPLGLYSTANALKAVEDYFSSSVNSTKKLGSNLGPLYQTPSAVEDVINFGGSFNQAYYHNHHHQHQQKFMLPNDSFSQNNDSPPNLGLLKESGNIGMNNNSIKKHHSIDDILGKKSKMNAAHDIGKLQNFLFITLSGILSLIYVTVSLKFCIVHTQPNNETVCYYWSPTFMHEQ